MYMGMAIIAISLIIGISSIFILGHDNEIEELTETIVEDRAEELLDLNNDELKNKIDFSFETKEK